MKLTLIVLVAVCLAAAAPDGDYDYEDEAIPAATKPPAKAGRLGGLLLPRNRSAGPLATRKSTTAISSTANAKITSTTQQPAELVEEDYEEGTEEGAKQDLITTTTTEPTKKTGRAGAVRPFRSNEDLLAALKRRRAQGVTSHPKSTTTTEPSVDATPLKAKSNARTKSSSSTNEVPKSTSRQRFGGTRSKTTAAAAALHEEAQETRSEDVQLKPKSYQRRG